MLSRPRLGATVFVVLVSALLAWRSVQSDGRAADVAAAETTRPEVRAALQRDDSVAVLALLRTDDSSSALMLRADAALRIGRPAEAFDLLEKAVRVDGSVRSSAAFARIAIATLSAVPSSRVGSLVKDAASEEVRAELRKALSATEYRKRHGAQHVLTLLGEQVNEAPILYLDLMQLSDCDARRAVAKTLVRRNPDAPDLRDVLALARARDRDGCLEGIGLPEETASR